ncbi:MAG: hypothetical protein KF687_16405 [Cyclobacteriaceae bacterium]|nr:hypothetical protein [Cyclobacteriaceae bacterium]
MKTLSAKVFLAMLSLTGLHAQPGKNYTTLSEAMINPERVYWLTLRDEGLDQIPVEVFKLKNLKYLDLSRNNINLIPDDCCMFFLTNIKSCPPHFPNWQA